MSKGKRQDDWGSKSTSNTRNTSSTGTSVNNSATQVKGKAEWTSGSNNSSSTNTHTGEETQVNSSNSESSSSSGPSKTNNSSDNYSVINSTWDSTTTDGKTVGSNSREVYSEANSNANSSYDDGKSKNTSNRDTYTVNESQETNSRNGSDYWINNRGSNYSETQSNDTQNYKYGPETRSHNRDTYSVSKSTSSSSNSSGKVSSKSQQENYSENHAQWESEYKADTYTTQSNSDESTITASKSNSSTEGNNSTSSNSSDTSTTRNSQTVTTYKDGRKTENGSSSYEKRSSESTYDSKGVGSSVSKYSSWSSSYSTSYFKGGYSWTETVSGSESESATKGGVSTSSGSSWSWTRSATVWDDGRNSWSESWSKSSWKDGKYAPGESEVTRGSFDPKGTGTERNNLPEFGEAPRLNKGPKQEVPIDLQKPPKPSDDIWRLPSFIIKEPPKDIDLNKPPKRKPPRKDFYERIADDKEPNILPDPNLFAGSGAPPPEKWPPQDIGSYWLSYSGTLKTTSQQRRQIFREIINNPSIQKVYMNVLSTQGTTFRYGTSMITDGDVFTEFKEELDRYNREHPNNRRTIDVIGWFEGTGLAAQSSPMYTAAKSAGALLEKHRGDGNAIYVDLVHPTVWGELQNIATEFINKHGGLVKEIIFDDRLGIPKAAEQDVANLHRSTITADTDSSDKNWIQRALTKNLASLKKALPSTRFSISGNLLRYALNDQNQDILNWLKSGIINGGYNLQLYKNGDQYNDFVKNYKEHMAELAKAKIPTDKLSLSIGYIASGVPLTRRQIRQQVDYLRNRNNSVRQEPRLSPSQILGFDYKKIADIK